MLDVSSIQKRNVWGFYFQSNYTEYHLDMMSKKKYDESTKELFQLKSSAFTWISIAKEAHKYLSGK